MFGYSNSQLKKLKKIAAKVSELADKYDNMPDDVLSAQTAVFKERLAKGETLEQILPDAYAALRAASTRVLGMRHYDVQILGGIALHQGRIAEMGTGEGKTLVATLPAYLNALTGEGVHIVTVNDYLVARDAGWMGNLYKFMGLTVGQVVNGMSPEEKRAAYNCDITYCANNELGFDFLRDNMVVSKEDKMQRSLAFAIVDEVDSILVDEARTPLIISGKADKARDLYQIANNFAKTCSADENVLVRLKSGVWRYFRYNPLTKLCSLGCEIKTPYEYLKKCGYTIDEREICATREEYEKKLERDAAHEKKIDDGLEVDEELKESKYIFDEDGNRVWKAIDFVRAFVQRGIVHIIKEKNSFFSQGPYPIIREESGKADDYTKYFEYRSTTDKGDKAKIYYLDSEHNIKCDDVDWDNVYMHSDLDIDEKDRTVMLTDTGILKAEKFYRIGKFKDGGKKSKYAKEEEISYADAEDYDEGLTNPEHSELYHCTHQALKAHFLMKKDIDYIVSEGEVLIIDEFTGRIMVGRRFNDGLHQAIEAKEKVVVRSENKTLATITFQNFFRMYKKLSGMTGTAKTEEDEFKEIYSLDVVTIPPNKPSQRIDYPDRIYQTREAKMRAVVRDIQDCYERKQPVLVGTVSVEKSEELSRELNKNRIPHKVLNAKYHKKEAEIIAQAGRKGAITIATNMAGRGTDIMLGGNPDYIARENMERGGYPADIIELASSPYEIDDARVKAARNVYKRYYNEAKATCDAEKVDVIETGGLHIIGTERHESRRIDNQLRGRSGRQGDPGSTVFYLSMEDDMVRIFGGEKMQSIVRALSLDENEPIASRIITKLLERSQRSVEGRNYSARKQVLSYDDVMNSQRELIYTERGKVLDGLDIHDQILDMIGELAEHIIEEHADYKIDYNTWDYEKFNRELERLMLPHGTNLMNAKLCSCYDVYKLKDAVLEVALKDYEQKIAKAKEDDIDFGEVERLMLLKTVDRRWIEHVDEMENLRKGIGLRGYGQRDPVIAYRQEGWDMFEKMVENIHFDTAAACLKVKVEKNPEKPKRQEYEMTNQKVSVFGGGVLGKRPSPNDPCPCGSGKTYKKCCRDKDMALENAKMEQFRKNNNPKK